MILPSTRPRRARSGGRWCAVSRDHSTCKSGALKTASSMTTTAPVHEEGFWASLFGSGPEHGHETRYTIAVWRKVPRSLRSRHLNNISPRSRTFSSAIIPSISTNGPRLIGDPDHRNTATDAPVTAGTLLPGRLRAARSSSLRRRWPSASAPSIVAPHASVVLSSKPQSKSKFLCVTRPSRLNVAL